MKLLRSGQWKQRVSMMPTLSSLAAAEVVVTTISGVTFDDKVDIMTTLGFQGYSLSVSMKLLLFCHNLQNASRNGLIHLFSIIVWHRSLWVFGPLVYTLVCIYPYRYNGHNVSWLQIMRLKIMGIYDDVIKWKHFPRYWPFVRGIHRLPVNSPHKGQWRGALMFSLISAWINGWVSNGEAGDLRRHHAQCDVIVMFWYWIPLWVLIFIDA